MEIWVCDACGEKIISTAEPQLSTCGVVGAFFSGKPEPAGIVAEEESEPDEEEGLFSLSDARGVPRGEPTGIRALDRALSGGIPRGVPVLIYGPAYSGKSTLAIQIACHLPGPPLFCVPEMSREMTRTISDRSGADISAVITFEGERTHWPRAAEKARARVVLIDSVSKFPDPRAAVEQCVQWARSTGGICLAIAHQTRRGKPLFRAEYEPDAVFRVTRNKASGRRTLEIEKARWNGASEKIRL